MIMWGFPALGCTLLVSALLLRRWPLAALAVMLGGSVASTAQQPASTRHAGRGRLVFACGAGLEISYMAATRTRRVSVTGVAMVAGVSAADPVPERAVSRRALG